MKFGDKVAASILTELLANPLITSETLCALESYEAQVTALAKVADDLILAIQHQKDGGNGKLQTCYINRDLLSLILKE